MRDISEDSDALVELYNELAWVIPWMRARDYARAIYGEAATVLVVETYFDEIANSLELGEVVTRGVNGSELMPDLDTDWWQSVIDEIARAGDLTRETVMADIRTNWTSWADDEDVRQLCSECIAPNWEVGIEAFDFLNPPVRVFARIMVMTHTEIYAEQLMAAHKERQLHPFAQQVAYDQTVTRGDICTDDHLCSCQRCRRCDPDDYPVKEIHDA